MTENLFENKIKSLIAAGKPVWGASLPDASEFLAKLSVDTGIDFLWIDLEHRPFEVQAVRWIPIICRSRRCEPLIRVAGVDPQLIKKALDIGASTIMVPQINNAEEARLAVQYAKYPPEGTRGISPLWTFYMDVPWDEYLPRANQETCIVVQIESPSGIQNLERIAAVPGVDVVFAGPMDLSACLGHIGHPEHPEVQKFLDEFPSRVAKVGKPAGITLRGFDASKDAYDKGYRFICIGGIVFQGIVGLAADLKKLRDLDTRPDGS